jgi:uncharacterized membrane protein (UPF0127 family)
MRSTADPYLEFLGEPSVRVYVEIAATPEQRARGLMMRPSLAWDRGMLFVFPTEVRQAFWGRDIVMPLSVGFIGSDGLLLEILDLEPSDVGPRQPAQPYQYALEVNRGWFAQHQVWLGRRMRFESSGGPIRVS